MLDSFLAVRQDGENTYVISQEIDTDVDAFDHVQKVGLEDERLPRVIEHAGCLF